MVLAPDLAEVARARHFLRDVAAGTGLSDSRVFDLTVASSEAIANAIEHAPVKGHVEVTALVYADRLEVRISGPGEFQTPNRLAGRVNRGLGLPLMAKLADHLALYSAPEGGTLVTLTFYREGHERALQPAPLATSAPVGLPPSDLDIDTVGLADLIDLPGVQSILEDFRDLARVPLAIIDTSGRVLVGAGWSEICTRFHRAHPETSCHCVESDLELSAGIPEGEYKLYKCKNNMWDIATPIIVGGHHMGSIFSGQFFFDDEIPDYEFFRAQAQRYAFDESDYLTALDAVPRLSRATIDSTIAFFAKFARMLSNESYARLRLSHTLAERDALLESVKVSEERFRSMFERHKAVMLLIDPQTGDLVDANPAAARFYGHSRDELKGLGIGDLNQLPAEWVVTEYRKADSEMADHFVFPHLAAGGEKRWVEVYSSPIELRGKRLLFSIIHDITSRLEAERALRESEERYRLLAKENDRLYRQQLDIAENLQLALLNVPAQLDGVRMAHLYRSATETAWVGGDFYDVFSLGDGKVVALMGDVAGHGVQAARTATLVKDVVHAFVHQGASPAEVLKKTNRLLVEKALDGFVSLFLGVLDTADGTLRYCSAGHPDTLLRRSPKNVHRLQSASSPLGVFFDATWREEEVELRPEDILLLYTDGVTEARNGALFFGEDRLQTIVRDCSTAVEQLPHLILDEVLAFTDGILRDDLALLALSLAPREH